MRYFTARQLKGTAQDHAHGILESCAGKSVRDGFAIRVFNQYHDAVFPDRGKPVILDCGTASGAFVAQLAAAGYRQLYGIDLDDYRREEHRRHFVEFRVADGSWDALPWPDQFFDVVSAWCVLPHLENPFHCLREIHRVLKPGGLFIFTAPHLTSRPSLDYFSRKKDFKSYRPTNNHLVLFTRGVIEKTALRTFNLLATEYYFRAHKIFRGPRGKLRQLAYRLAAMHPKAQRALDERWAYDAAYVLKKKEL